MIVRQVVFIVIIVGSVVWFGSRLYRGMENVNRLNRLEGPITNQLDQYDSTIFRFDSAHRISLIEKHHIAEMKPVNVMLVDNKYRLVVLPMGEAGTFDSIFSSVTNRKPFQPVGVAYHLISFMPSVVVKFTGNSNKINQLSINCQGAVRSFEKEKAFALARLNLDACAFETNVESCSVFIEVQRSVLQKKELPAQIMIFGKGPTVYMAIAADSEGEVVPAALLKEVIDVNNTLLKR